MFSNGRQWWALGFLATTVAMLFALYLQYFRGFEPCAMCIFQRVAMIVAGLVFLFAFAINPLRWGRWLAGLTAFAAAAAGAAVAGRHVWLQSLPEDRVPACGAGLEAMMNVFPLHEVVALVLSGDGNCAVIDWTFLGLSLPAWTLITFVALALWALLAIRLTRR